MNSNVRLPSCEPLAVLDYHHPFSRDRHQLAVQLPVQGLAVHGDRAGHQLRGVDHVRRAARVQYRPGVRQRLHHLAGAARMVEVHVGQEQPVHLLAGDAEFVERRQQPRRRRAGAGVDEGRAAVLHHEVAAGEAGAHVERVDQVHAVAERLRQPGSGRGRRGNVGGRGHPSGRRYGCGPPSVRRRGAENKKAGGDPAFDASAVDAAGIHWSSHLPPLRISLVEQRDGRWLE